MGKSMRALITIFQHNYVVLPHIFIKHIFPRMKERFNGIMEICIIRNIYNNNKIVNEWTEQNKFNDVRIINYSDNGTKPYWGYEIGIETALKKNVDFPFAVTYTVFESADSFSYVTHFITFLFDLVFLQAL